MQEKILGVIIAVLIICIVLGGYFVAPFLGLDIGNTNPEGTNDQNSYTNQEAVVNDNTAPDNPTINYDGSGQLQVAFIKKGNTVSGDVTGNINCIVERNDNSITFSITIIPTNISENLRHTISNGDGDNTITFNFEGTTSGTQLNASSKGTINGNNNSFSFNIIATGTIDQNTLTFTLTPVAASQISISTVDAIVLYPS